MKIIQSTILIAAMISATLAFGQDVKYKRYKHKSGVIEYKFTGDQTGSETLYFDNYGMRVAKHTNAELKIGKQATAIKKLDLIKGGHQYIIDLLSNSGTRIVDPTLNGLEPGEEHDLTHIAREKFKEMGGEMVGTEKVAGKECEVWEMPNLGLKIWLWEGLTLRSTTKIPGLSEVNLVAWNIQTDVAVPEDKMRIPPGANITENEEPIELGE